MSSVALDHGGAGLAPRLTPTTTPTRAKAPDETGLTDIVIVNDAGCIRGGADRIAFASACGLAARGYRVTFLAGFGPIDSSLQQVPNLTVHCLGTGWLREQQRSARAALRGMWNWSAAAEFRRIVAGLSPRTTLVHVHLYSSALTASVLHASAKKFATTLTLHDYFVTCPNGAYFVFPRGEPCQRRALSASCLRCHCDSRHYVHKVWRVARTLLQNRVARIPQRLAGYAAVSRACAELARRDLPSAALVRLVPNIVEVDRSPRVPVAQNREFVFAGRLEPYKGPQLLAAAARRLDLPVVFCGTGPLEPTLKRMIPGARFTGWLSPAAMAAQLSKARAFIFPSVYRETFGLSAAEALARGLPVIAARGTAAEEFIHHDRNGLLFARNSVDELADQLRTLTDDTIVDRLARNAYADYWSSPLTLENHLDHLEEFYSAVMTTRLAMRRDPRGVQR